MRPDIEYNLSPFWWRAEWGGKGWSFQVDVNQDRWGLGPFFDRSFAPHETWIVLWLLCLSLTLSWGESAGELSS